MWNLRITADLIDAFGYVKSLDIILKTTSKALRDKCDCYVPEIVVSEDDVTYASMIAKVLVPEFEEEIGLPEIACGLGSKPKDAGKAIANCDKQEIRQSLERLSFICKEKKFAHQQLLTFEAQTGVARMTVGDEAVGKLETGTELAKFCSHAC
ncbi:hypothetical protein C2845_PM09G12770 [Panicum miliaceum]|uniref:Uncharacterized protein n=1 Tax=Panicum miliaceum TaxID=4540 RepID=A0A3L6S387_PANMI|nr:hypothetical protein C2845_PM09G12770 [Panicum miliaceum]